MAYAALLSLRQTLNQILLRSNDSHSIAHYDFESLSKDLEFFQQFLESAHPSTITHETRARDLEAKIRDVVYQAQDFLDFSSSSSIAPTMGEQYNAWDQEAADDFEIYVMKLKRGRDLENVIQEADSIKQEIHLLQEEKSGLDRLQLQQPSNPLRAKFGSDGKHSMVGFDDKLMQIKDELTGQPSLLKVIPIVGMGGIGKTTLAIHTCTDSYISFHFDTLAWATISQSYSRRNILLDLLDSMKQSTPKMRQEIDDEELVCHIYKILKETRYLVVIDDIWDTDAWDAVRRAFPDDNNGSRILITTRITDVAAYAASSLSGCLYQMSPLSDDGSWNLLCDKVFGSNESCPFDLREIGMNIAQKCGGLPLSIVVIGGLLSKVNHTYEGWKGVEEHITSLLTSSDDMCSEILKMSYRYLPQHLKSCFLYMAVFPEDHEIYVSKLTKLWIAEGFLDGICCSQRLEDVAESYLQELIDRCLVSMFRKRHNGKLKTCKIHDLLLDLCVREASCEKFLKVTKSYINLLLETTTWQRRICIQRMNTAGSNDGWANYIQLDPYAMSSVLVRSLVCIGRFMFNSTDGFKVFNLLRVLDIMEAVFTNFPDEVFELLHLHFIALSCENVGIPSSVSKLKKLQTLIVQRHGRLPARIYREFYVPNEIWKMAHLRHLEFRGIFLELGNDDTSKNDVVVLDQLQTLAGIKNLRFSSELMLRIRNIRKLHLFYLLSPNFELENLANLHQLKELKIEGIPRGKSPELKLPGSLETLCLMGCRFPWEDLSSMAGALPNLQVLKLKNRACEGEEWECNEGEFQQLKVLVLEGLDCLVSWEAECDHFPALERIVVGDCRGLAGIPLAMGDSATLAKIELWGALKKSVWDSAYEIEENQRGLGNYEFRVVKSGKVSSLNIDIRRRYVN